MNDAHRMGCFQGAADLPHYFHRFLWLKYLLLGNQAAQVLALDVLHGDELDSIGIAHVVNANHVLVRDLVREHKFLLEAVKDGRIPSQFRTNHFKRDRAIHFAIPRPVNRPHASFTKNLLDFVSAP